MTGVYGRLPVAEILLRRPLCRENDQLGQPLATNVANVTHGVELAPQALVAMHVQRRARNLPLRVSKGVIVANHHVAGVPEPQL